MKRKKSGEKRRTPSAVAALGGKPIEIARIDGDAEAWLAVFADRIAVATDKETEERHWFEFERATWSGNTLTMPFVDWNIPAFELKLADGEEDIALVVRERLERSIVVRRSSKLPSGAEVRAMVRRDDKDDLFTQVIIDGRAKEEDEQAIAELEETLRDIVGLEPAGDEGWGVSDDPSPESALRADDADAADPQASPEEAEGARKKEPEEDCADVEAADEKSQTSAEADVVSPEPLAAAPAESVEDAEAGKALEVAEAVGDAENAETAEAPEAVEAAEVAGDARADEAVGSANGPEVGVAAAAQGADGAFSGEAPESEASSAGASHAPGALAVSESAPELESPTESESAPAPESPSSTSQDVPAPESDLEPEGSVSPDAAAPESAPAIPAVSQSSAAPKSEPETESLTPSGVEELPGASVRLANPREAGVGESSADASSNSPRGGAEQPSAAAPATNIDAATNAAAATSARAATNAHAATSADAASPANAVETDAEGPVPDAEIRGSGPEAPERGEASST